MYWSEAAQSWFLTRHEDVASGFRDPRLSANRTQLFVEHQMRGLDASILEDWDRVTGNMMLMSDGQKHARLLRLVEERRNNHGSGRAWRSGDFIGYRCSFKQPWELPRWERVAPDAARAPATVAS